STLFRGLRREKVALAAQQIFFQGVGKPPNIDNELRAKHVNTRSTPASRRDAQKIGGRFSAGYLRYAIGPVPEGRGERTGQDDSISRVSGRNQPMLSRSSWFDEVPLGAGLSAIRSAG